MKVEETCACGASVSVDLPIISTAGSNRTMEYNKVMDALKTFRESHKHETAHLKRDIVPKQTYILPRSTELQESVVQGNQDVELGNQSSPSDS